jgi:6-phosphogluconate dehydrogenase (decarboxylating)
MQDLDQVLVMMVNRGFGHQHFLHATLPKIRRARHMSQDGAGGSGDVGTNGGVWPWRVVFAMMIGGPEKSASPINVFPWHTDVRVPT